jgi:multidrug efflux pump subunit AcrA (membrane-fusion protein)
MPVEHKTPLTLVPAPRPPGALSWDVHEFMGRPPHWLLRSGTVVLAAGLALILTLSTVIEYPDTIVGHISITGTEPVLEVIARQSGHLESLRVREGQIVAKGDILAIIENPARSATVLALGEKLAQLARVIDSDASVVSIPFQPENSLGKLQQSYADFLQTFRQVGSRLADDYAEKAGALLRQQIAGKRTQIASLREQSKITTRELDLAQAKFARTKVLSDRRVISVAELQDQEMALFQQMLAETAAKRAATDAEIDAAKLEKELRDLEHERTESLRIAREQLRAQLNKLRGEIDVWDADFVLRAPTNGVASFYDFWSDQQFVNAQRQVFLIVPETTHLLGHMSVTTGGGGKIRPGQPVRVRLDDYPYKEFGLVVGTVQSVSMVPREGTHLVLIDLRYPLITSFHRPLQFKQQMTGEARIVTENMRLIGRILYEIRRAFVNNK